MAELAPFLPPFFPPPEISLFWGTSISITFSVTQKLLPTVVERRESMEKNRHVRVIQREKVKRDDPMEYSSLSPFLADGRCFRIWVLITYQFFYLPLSFWSFAQTSVPLPSIFRKLTGMTLLPTLTLTVLQQRNTRLFLFSLLLLFSLL